MTASHPQNLSETAAHLPGFERLCARILRGIILVVGGIGAANLAVWLIPSLQWIASWPGVMVMRANTGLATTVAAFSLLMWHLADRRPKFRTPALVLAWVPLIIGAVTCLEYMTGINMGLDQLLAPGTFMGDRANPIVVAPGRMSFNASLALFFVGLALTGLDWTAGLKGRRRIFAAPWLALLGTLPVCFGLVGYLLGRGGFTGLLKSTNILFHTAACLFLLAIGVLLVRPRRQPVSGFFSAGAEGVLLRWMLPGSAVVLIGLAALIAHGRSLNLIQPGEGTAMMLFGGLVLMFVLIVAASRAVRQQEASANATAVALREAKERAEKASQAKDDFIAVLSHELRTPLTPVLLSASTLREDQRLPEDVRKQLAMIERNVTLEARLIDDLLDLTRIVTGKLLLRRERCDVHDLLGYAVEIVSEEAQSRRLTLETDFQARRSVLEGDSARLQQVFWNLLKNAVKFTAPGGRVRVRSRDAEGSDALIVEITDTGVGFTPEAAERLFLPFEQGMWMGDHQFGGLGLGLAIARAIVDLHGGKVEAQSEGAEKGATFTVRLPGARTPSPAGDLLVRDAAATPVHPSSLKILLVEDHEPTRKILAQLLVRAGNQVVMAASMGEAMAAMESDGFEVVVSDLGLPDGSGLDLMPKLRARSQSIQGIALSGYGMEEDVQRSSDAGFALHLVKPVRYEDLARALRQVSKGSTH